MNRKSFIKSIGLIPLATTMKLNELNKLTSELPPSETMPVLFLGHGNPMYAITENEYAHEWQQLGKTLPKPAAVLCISAHWQTSGTFVTAMDKPKTIHDFYGFPKELFAVEYPAPGSTALAKETQHAIGKAEVGFDYEWGLDHGCWSVLKHVYPHADIPVIEMSLDYRQSPEWHFALAKELAALRNKGVLIVGSGNMVHNLRAIDFNMTSGFDWALEASATIKKLITERGYSSLINYKDLGKAVQLAIPTNEHYLPMLYALALAGANENISFFNDKAEAGSITMTSLKIDKN
jgi:4,5-DOPA dioxygenase extradiol